MPRRILPLGRSPPALFSAASRERGASRLLLRLVLRAGSGTRCRGLASSAGWRACCGIEGARDGGATLQRETGCAPRNNGIAPPPGGFGAFVTLLLLLYSPSLLRWRPIGLATVVSSVNRYRCGGKPRPKKNKSAFSAALQRCFARALITLITSNIAGCDLLSTGRLKKMYPFRSVKSTERELSR